MKKNLIIFKTGACIRIFNLMLLLLPATLFGQVKITGTITDASDGSPLPGAYIVVQGTNTGTVSEQGGAFTNEAPADASLVISYMGYLSETIALAGQTTINVVLTPDLAKLDEVVVIGYGTMKKSDLTGAVSSVSGENLRRIPIATIDQALQGQAAGVNITTKSGRPGESVDIQIRGISSINGTQPLVIIDGIQGGDLNNINPSEIASIEVLKDASSAAIYG